MRAIITLFKSSIDLFISIFSCLYQGLDCQPTDYLAYTAALWLV